MNTLKARLAAAAISVVTRNIDSGFIGVILRNLTASVATLRHALDGEQCPRHNIGAECRQNSQVHQASCGHHGRIAALF